MTSTGIITEESVIAMAKTKAKNSAANGFESRLLFDADRLRKRMDTAEYKSGCGQTLSSVTNPLISIQSEQ